MITEQHAKHIFEKYGLPVGSGTHSGTSLVRAITTNPILFLHEESFYPPEADCLLLKSFLQYKARYNYGDPSMIAAEGWGATYIFQYAKDGWRYRVSTWDRGPMWVPEKPDTLLNVINRTHVGGKDKEWEAWVAKYPMGYRPEVQEEQYSVSSSDTGTVAELRTKPPMAETVAIVHGRTPEEAKARAERLAMLQDQLLCFTPEDVKNKRVSIHRRFKKEQFTLAQAQWWAEALTAMFQGIGIVHSYSLEWKRYIPEISSGIKIDKFEVMDYKDGHASVTYHIPGYYCSFDTIPEIQDRRAVVALGTVPNGDNYVKVLSPVGDGAGFNEERREIWRRAAEEQHRVGNNKIRPFSKILAEIRSETTAAK